jgi:hypothetical protein
MLVTEHRYQQNRAALTERVTGAGARVKEPAMSTTSISSTSVSSTSVSSVDALSQAVADHRHALDQASAAATVRSRVRLRQTTSNGARQVHRYPGRWLARVAAYLG